jgi:hypothetical protein
MDANIFIQLLRANVMSRVSDAIAKAFAPSFATAIA